MPAARFWRAVGLSAYGGGDVELSALQLYEGSGDAAYPQVSLLLHCDGANGATTFVDNSATPKTISSSGGASISTAQSKFGGASLSLSGGACLFIADHPGLGVATGDFTIEMWVRPASLSSNAILFNKQNGTAAGYPYQAYVSTAGAVVFRSYNESVAELFTIVTAAGKVAPEVWTHLAFVRSGTQFAVYVDGVASGSAIYAGALPENTWPMTVGAYSNGVAPFTGFIDDFRMTKGMARYTSGFPIPTAAFPNSAAVGNAVRVDAGAALTCSLAPVSGAIAALQDGDAGTRVRLPAREPGLALLWDFGAGIERDVSIVAPGASDSSALFLSHFDLQYSADARNWVQLSTLGRFAWPGPGAMLAPSFAGLPLLVPVTGSRAKALAGLGAGAQFVTSQARAELARDTEFGGNGRLWGTTKTEISPGVFVPTKARVSVLRQRDMLLAREVWSDPATGAWEVRGLDTSQTFLEVAQHVTGEKQAVAADQTIPQEVSP